MHGCLRIHVCMQRAVLLWTPHPAERDALLANEVTTKKHSAAHNHLVIMEIACTRTSRELFQVREDYHARYKRSLEEDIAYHTTGDFRKVRKGKTMNFHKNELYNIIYLYISFKELLGLIRALQFLFPRHQSINFEIYV